MSNTGAWLISGVALVLWWSPLSAQARDTVRMPSKIGVTASVGAASYSTWRRSFASLGDASGVDLRIGATVGPNWHVGFGGRYTRHNRVPGDALFRTVAADIRWYADAQQRLRAFTGWRVGVTWVDLSAVDSSATGIEFGMFPGFELSLSRNVSVDFVVPLIIQVFQGRPWGGVSGSQAGITLLIPGRAAPDGRSGSK